MFFIYTELIHSELRTLSDLWSLLIQVSGVTFPLLFVSIYLSNKRLQKRFDNLSNSIAQEKEEELSRNRSIIADGPDPQDRGYLS